MTPRDLLEALVQRGQEQGVTLEAAVARADVDLRLIRRVLKGKKKDLAGRVLFKLAQGFEVPLGSFHSYAAFRRAAVTKLGHLTTRRAARRIGVSKSSYNDFASGSSVPRASRLINYATSLGLDLVPQTTDGQTRSSTVEKELRRATSPDGQTRSSVEKDLRSATSSDGPTRSSAVQKELRRATVASPTVESGRNARRRLRDEIMAAATRRAKK